MRLRLRDWHANSGGHRGGAEGFDGLTQSLTARRPGKPRWPQFNHQTPQDATPTALVVVVGARQRFVADVREGTQCPSRT